MVKAVYEDFDGMLEELKKSGITPLLQYGILS